METSLPDVSKTILALKKNGYSVRYFDDTAAAADYLDEMIDGRTVGFGDSRTLIDMKMYERLSAHNEVFDPNTADSREELLSIAEKALTADVFLTSVNAMSETGEMVNIDGTGNRVAGSVFHHRKIIFVAGVNKIVPTLEDAVWRARNIAAPLNSRKYDHNTPCVKGEARCYDCSSEERGCNVMMIYMKKVQDVEESEVVLIGEPMGF